MILLKGFNHVYYNINGKSDTNLYEPLMSLLVGSAVRGAETEQIWWRLMKIGRGLNTFISEETLHKKKDYRAGLRGDLTEVANTQL